MSMHVEVTFEGLLDGSCEGAGRVSAAVATGFSGGCCMRGWCMSGVHCSMAGLHQLSNLRAMLPPSVLRDGLGSIVSACSDPCALDATV